MYTWTKSPFDSLYTRIMYDLQGGRKKREKLTHKNISNLRKRSAKNKNQLSGT